MNKLIAFGVVLLVSFGAQARDGDDAWAIAHDVCQRLATKAEFNGRICAMKVSSEEGALYAAKNSLEQCDPDYRKRRGWVVMAQWEIDACAADRRYIEKRWGKR